MSVHCDDLIDDPEQLECLRRYLGWARLSATLKYPPDTEEGIQRWIPKRLQPHVWRGPPPKLFADHEGRRVRVVMASRFGDVGITTQLKNDFGYDLRVPVSDLSKFGDTP